MSRQSECSGAKAPRQANGARSLRCALLALLWCLFATAGRADLRVVGTDLLGVEFSKGLYEFAGRNGLRLALAFDGSRPGWAELEAGRADAALLVLPPAEETAPVLFRFIPIGYHCVVVVVPAACPLPRVTLDQLAGIFGAGGTASIARWGELGLTGDWSGRVVTPLAPEAGTGIALEYFRETVLPGREFKPGVARYRSAVDLTRRFSGDARVLALASALPAGAPTLKAVPVAASARDRAFLPTPENLHSGDYPLRLSVRLAFRVEAAPTIRPLLQFLLSETAAGLLLRAEIMPLPPSARAQQLLAVEK